MGSRITKTNVGYFNAFYGQNGTVEFKNGPKAITVTPTAVPTPLGSMYPGLRRASAPITTPVVVPSVRSTTSDMRVTRPTSLESKLLRILAEGGWHTLASLAKRTNMSKDSVGSALRRMRTVDYGNHNIVSNRGSDRKWRYANMANLARNDRRFAEGQVQAIAA